MKLPNFINSIELNSLKTRMGISADHFGTLSTVVSLPRLNEDELDKLTSGVGIEVSFDELSILEDGTLSYKGRRVLLYIRDRASYFNNDSLPKYHLASCRTLENARNSGQSGKYVIANRTDGVFKINTISGGQVSSKDESLRVCKNCLDQLKIGGYTPSLPMEEKDQRVKAFRPQTFFDLYPIDLHAYIPLCDEVEAPLNTYSEGFYEISSAYKASKNWTCEKCRRDFSKGWKQKFLQTHHKNGMKYDDLKSNFKALCIECHASEPQHDHMKKLPVYLEYKTLESKGFF